MNEEIRLQTFPDDDRNYCKSFVVPKDWLLDIIGRLDELNNREGVDLDRFMENYIWDESWFIYLKAKQDEVLIEESEGEDESIG